MKFSELKYLFYCNIDNKVVYFQALLDKYFLLEEALLSNYGLAVRLIDCNSENDLRTWCDIINNSYNDCHYDVQTAKEQLSNQLFLENTKTYLFTCNETKLLNKMTDSNICATVSTGNFKGNKSVGGIFRIACRNSYKGRGYGKAIVLFALSKLQQEGYKICEDLVSSKRHVSIMMHMELGFEPQFSYDYVTYKKNLKNLNYIQKIRLWIFLKKMHSKYLRKMSMKFLQ